MKDERIELLRLAEDLSALRLALIARRWGLDYKYRPGQTRIAAGNGRQSGQFADEGRGTSRRAGNSALVNAARKIAPKIGAAIIANPEAAAAAGSAALPLLAGGVAMSRAAGLASVLADGGGTRPGSLHMTPMLGIPYRLDDVERARENDQVARRGQIEEECEEQFKSDQFYCEVQSATYAKSNGYTRDQAMAVCMRQAMTRYSECLAGDGPSSIRSPLFSPRKTNGRKKRK